MLSEIIYFLRRIFKINSVKCLATPDSEGINWNYEPQNNFNLISSGYNNIDNNFQLEPKEERAEAQDKDLISGNLLDHVLEPDKNDEELEDDDEYEYQFEYDENKVEEMNKKIDYYKKDPDKLYLLTLKEILEINFYYEKRIQKLENSNN